jgi:radical SAM protein with 4Fe4S-binding SPASM domain
MELKELQISITNKCNIGCEYCYKSKDNEVFLSIEQINKIISLSKKLGINVLRLTGGDVFEHPNLIEILKKIKENDLKIILNITIKRINDFSNVKEYCDYILFSFQNFNDIKNYGGELIKIINENKEIKFMGCMVFQNSLLDEIGSLLEKISLFSFDNFFFLRDVCAKKNNYYVGLLNLSGEITKFNENNKTLKNPIRIANAFPLCYVKQNELKYLDGCKNDDGNSFVYIDEGGNLKLNSYSGTILGNINNLNEKEFNDKILIAKEKKRKLIEKDERCLNCKIKDKCQGGISYSDKFSLDSLLKFRSKHIAKFENFSKLQKEYLNGLIQKVN